MTRPKRRRMVKRSSGSYLQFWPLVVMVAAVALGLWFWQSRADTNSSHDQGSSASPKKTSNDPKTAEPLSSFDKNQYSISDPSSLWVIVNKGRQLPSDYRPDDLVIPSTKLRYLSGSEMMLRAEAAQALAEMFNTASNDGIKLMLASGFRSFSLQEAIYQRHVNDFGLAQADRVSARPGHSEHQTGWAADVAPTSGRCLIEECFGGMAEGRWVATRAADFGFILRYPAGGEALTGYSYEPWHIRYVGKLLSAELKKDQLTLEQFFNLPTFATYPESISQL